MEEKGVWRTVKGRRVFIAEGQSLSEAMEKSGKFSKPVAKAEHFSKMRNKLSEVDEEADKSRKDKEKEELKAHLKDLVEQMNKFVAENAGTNGELTEEQRDVYTTYNKEISDLKYKLETEYFSEVSEKHIKSERLTGFEKEVYADARRNDLKNKAIYDALSEASWGATFNSDTPVDDIMNGKNKNISAKELYDTFESTRQILRENHGDELTLYRVEGLQKQKATKNYGSSYTYTKQYGADVKEYRIPTKDVVAIWTNRTGTYEDVIVATGGIEKYTTLQGRLKKRLKNED